MAKKQEKQTKGVIPVNVIYASNIKNDTCVPDHALNHVAYHAYRNRTLPPVERIADIIYEIIRNYNRFQNLNSEYEKAKQVAPEIKVMYDEIVSLVKLTDIPQYGVLIKVLSILNMTYPPAVLGDRMSYDFKFTIEGKDRETNLYTAIREIASNYGLYDKHEHYFSEIFKENYIKEIQLLEKKGEHICMSKTLHEWYRTHVHDWGAVTKTNKIPWRERKEHELGGDTLPWERERRGFSYHRLKVGAKFGGTRNQKIEIIELGYYNDLHREHSDIKTHTEISHDNYEHEAVLVKHIGGETDGVMELFTIFDLRDYATNVLYPNGISLHSTTNIQKYLHC